MIETKLWEQFAFNNFLKLNRRNERLKRRK